MTASTRHPGRPIDAELQARRREEILAAAAKLFAEKGYVGADTQLLADRVEVAKGTVFRYFPTKQELFFAAIDRGMDRLKDWVDDRAAVPADPLDKIIAAVRAYLEYFELHPELVELIILERAHFKDRKSTYFTYRDKKDDSHWDRLIEGLIADGRLREVSPARVRDVVGDLLYGTMFTNHLSGRQHAFHEQARELLDVVFHGLLTDAERRRASDANPSQP